ncbi:hypothetical protein SAMN02745126_00190 [Enhydrobacter aerosaccus]|jgi:hypothetical protein|uniref:Uncharacterized protein n=1 Tax=Enhydrobacter aerosaccus TaxID=225324 RepID=A0A1T4JMT0_9HYPH|nr:hypothetical protein SAMN02745126_00190 [Enhydrobacter aerosaccus]
MIVAMTASSERLAAPPREMGFQRVLHKQVECPIKLVLVDQIGTELQQIIQHLPVRGEGQLARRLAQPYRHHPRPRHRLFAQRRHSVGRHEAPHGPVHYGAAHPIARAMSSSPARASAASRICARFSSRAACLPPLSGVTSSSSARSAWLGSMVLGTRRPHHTTAERRMKYRHLSIVSHQACRSSSCAATRQILFDELLAAVCFSALTVRGVVGPCSVASRRLSLSQALSIAR